MGGREGGRETRSARSRKAGPGRLGRVRGAGTWGSLRVMAKCHDSVRPEVSPGRSSVRPRGGSFDGRKTRPLTAGVRLGLAAGDAASGWPPDGGDLRCDGGGERKAALSLRPAAAVGRPAECVRVCVCRGGAGGGSVLGEARPPVLIRICALNDSTVFSPDRTPRGRAAQGPGSSRPAFSPSVLFLSL